jgi:hypothetical protein
MHIFAFPSGAFASQGTVQGGDTSVVPFTQQKF